MIELWQILEELTIYCNRNTGLPNDSDVKNAGQDATSKRRRVKVEI